MLESPSIAIAFAAGFVSFASPCCLPLVPGYLAAVTGGDLEDIESLGRGRILMRSLVFVSTFSLIFILFGLGATAAGAFLFDNQETLNLVAGAVIVAMGAYFLAALVFPRINMEFRSRNLAERAGNGGPIVAGAAFAVAWTPCVGPTLGAILGLAASTQGTAQGGVLLAVYSAGLAVPFLLASVAFSSASTSFGWFKRHYVALQVTSGVTLILMGVLVMTGELLRLNIEAQQMLDDLGLNFFKSV